MAKESYDSIYVYLSCSMNMILYLVRKGPGYEYHMWEKKRYSLN